MEQLKDFVQSPYFGIFSFVTGIIVTTIYYFKSLKFKEIKYITKTYNIVKDYSSKFTNLSIKYNGEEVKNFSVTKVIFWNNGKETINGSDITAIEPLKISIGERFKILDSNIIQTNNQASQINIKEIMDDHLLITFDYLDYLNGAGINIIHNGSGAVKLEFTGKIKGLKRIEEVSILNAPKEVHYFIPIPIHHDVSKYSPNKRRYLYGLSNIVSGTAFTIILSVFKFIEILNPDSKLFSGTDQKIPWLIVALPGLLFILNGLYILLKRIPKGLDVYEDL